MKIPLLFAILSLLNGCSSVGPKYQTPSTPQPIAFKETGDWSMARPQEDHPHGKWWELFGDSELNSLEEQVNPSNQNIAASFASFLQARAMIQEARSQFLPLLSAAPNVTTQNGQSTPTAAGSLAVSTGTFTQYSLPLEATWAPDLWGRIRDTVRQSVAAAQVAAADLENEKLIEQADLAIYYYELRAQDSLTSLYSSTVQAYQTALKLTQALQDTGIDSDESVAQAESQLELAQAQATQLAVARAQYEHAIAVLIGKPASDFSIPPAELRTSPPAIPLTVPSKLLERRPDVAAAERSVAAANAQIGVAMAAYYPNLNLTGATGIGSNSLSSLFSAPAFVWSVGASLTQTLFDGGLRRATVDQYRAAYLQTVATYRQTVLTAFQQVEDDLAGLRTLEKELKQQSIAVKSTERYLRIATDRYRLGLDPYLDVISAQTAVLSAQQTLITLQMQQLTYSVQLIEALGGNWNRSELPSNWPLSLE